MPALPLSEILELSVAERIRLARDVWDSVAADSEALPPSDEQTEELDRRLAELERNPRAGSPWEHVRARLSGGA